VVTAPQGAVIGSWLARSRAALIFDLYDPGPLETLEIHAGASPLRRSAWTMLAVDQVLDALHLGNRFICASERQRDLWVGAMLGRRLLTPRTYDRDPSLRSLIETVPFGVPAQVPERVGGGVRERFPAIGPDDEVVLWNGGVWNWLDPVTAVLAMATLHESRRGARLVFMGRPPLVGDATAAREARQAAAELGLLDSVVFFNDAWVPYDERAAWLLDAACAVSTQHDHIETRFAFRTRLLDCFWAGLPVVCTAGDDLAELVDRRDLGATALPGDAAAVAAALQRTLARGRSGYAESLAATAAELAWPRVASRLVDYVTAESHPPRLGSSLPLRAARPLQRLRSAGIRLGRAAWPARAGS
jgi:glycosyltransferase involved in cell wall biosynthesis